MLTLLLVALTAPAPHAIPVITQAPAAAARQAPDSDQTIPVEKGSRLVLDNDAGEIIVRGWDRNEVRVQARHSSRATIRVRTNGPVVTVSASAQRGLSGAVDYDLSVPRWMPIKVGGLGAYVQVDDLQADVSAETMRGDVVIRGVSGPITASSVEGEIVIERSTGRIQANAINRAVVISEASGDIVAESISGGARLSGIRSRNVEVNALSGQISYDGTFAPDGTYRLMTHSGNIVVTTPALDATLTLRLFSGRFDSVFPTEQIGTPRRGQAVTHVAAGGRARVAMETFSGNIRIRKP